MADEQKVIAKEGSEPWDVEPVCAKCKCKANISRKFCQKSVGTDKVEHWLQLKCPSCGFVWDSATADMKEDEE